MVSKEQESYCGNCSIKEKEFDPKQM